MLHSLYKFTRHAAVKIIGDARMRRYWLKHNGTQGADYLDMYWNGTENQNRKFLADLVSSNLRQNGSVLEFGSHVGVNLRVLQNARPSDDFQLMAVEPSKAVFDYLIDKFPGAKALHADDRGFVGSPFPNQAVDVSVVNGVFCVMAEKRAQAVLQKLASISDVIVIGDNIDNLDGRSSTIHADPVHYRHPLRRMLQDFGMTRFETHQAPLPDHHINGYIVAAKA